jgi:rSAM/selenodomain-associated transferase 2
LNFYQIDALLSYSLKSRAFYGLLTPILILKQRFTANNDSFPMVSELRDGELKVSVIIPSLNEASVLESTLTHVKKLAPYEVIVVDGGSEDSTLDIAGRFDAKLVSCQKGRSIQMNAGAVEASGDLLLFLHADSSVDLQGYMKMKKEMKNPRWVGGAFSLYINSDKIALRIVAAFATLRSRFLHLAYGDQTLFVRARVFREMGGFPDVPICEDLSFFRKLSKKGSTLMLKERSFTSPRRWQAEGVIFTTARNFVIAVFFLLGVSPDMLCKWYPEKR